MGRGVDDVSEHTTRTLTVDERAELEMLRDVAKRLINFDGGAEVMAWVDAHRLHKTEPYIGCPFCHDQFVPCDQAAVERSADRLLGSSDWRDMSPTEVAEFVLRAAGETP